MSSLVAIEMVIGSRIHCRVFNFELLSGFSDLKSLPKKHEDGCDEGKDDIAVTGWKKDSS